MFFIQLYGNIDDLCNSRILEELDYYMYDVRDKSEMIYYFTIEQSIFIVLDDKTSWTAEKLQAVIRTSLRDNRFLLMPMGNSRGYMATSTWDNINEVSKKFFENPQAYRKQMRRGNKITKLKSLIKRFQKTQK